MRRSIVPCLFVTICCGLSPATLQAADTRPVIVVLGDSLAAGFGLAPGESFPDDLQKLLDQRGLRFRVVNQGISGDTTSGGAARVKQALQLKPALATALSGRGAVYLRRKQYSLALADFDAAIRSNPRFAPAYASRARARAAVGDSSGAAADRRREAELHKR